MRLLIIVLISFISKAEAAKNIFAVGAGANINETKAEVELRSDTAEKGTATLVGGIKNNYFFTKYFSLRLGLFVEEKTARFMRYQAEPYREGEIELFIRYLTIPINLQLNLSENFGVFSGIVPHYKLSDECFTVGLFDTCDLASTHSQVMYGVLGFSFNLNRKLDLDLSYQYPVDENLDKIRIATFQAMLFYKFN